MRRSCVILKAAVLFLLLPCLVDLASAEVTTFVELGNLSLFPKDTDSLEGGPVQLLLHRHQLESAVLKAREWAQEGKQLDFAVVLGIGLDGFSLGGPDPAEGERLKLLAAERLIALQVLPVGLIAVLPGPQDLDPGSATDTERFRSFVAVMRSVLKDKKIVDLSQGVLQVREHTVIGFSSASFSKQAGSEVFGEGRAEAQLREVRRVVNSVKDRRPVILFSYTHDLKKGLGDFSTWNVPSRVRESFLPLINDSRVIGVFGSPCSAVEWTVFGAPHAWQYQGAPGGEINKAWLCPSVTAVGGGISGLQFVSVSADGQATAVPMALPGLLVHKSRPQHSSKLAEGDAHLAVDDFDTAIAAYGKALESTDAGIASQGAQRLESALAKRALSEHLSKLSEGDAYWAAEEFDGAIAAYKEALSSKDSRVSRRATQSLHSALFEKRAATDGLRWRLLPRWIRNYRLDFAFVGLCAFLLFAARYPIAKFLLWRKPFESRWRVRLLTTPKDDLQSDVFLEEFFRGVEEIEALPTLFAGDSSATRVTSQSRSLEMFAFPLDLADVLKPGEHSLGSVDIGTTAKTLQTFMQHFSWRLEIRVSISDKIPHAYATLRWGPQIERMWGTPNPGNEPTASIKDAGRNLAFEIFSKGWIK